MEITLKYNDDEVPISFGDKFYIVEPCPRLTKHFQEKCPVCDDTHKINVRGFEFDCPYCHTLNNNSTHITVRKYEVREYYVNKFQLVGSENKKDYIPYVKIEPRLTGIYAFTKSGNGYGDVSERTVYESKYQWDPDLEDEERLTWLKREPHTYYWHTKKDAEKFCKMLNDTERKNLADFNAAHGTKHEYPFEENK